MNWSFLYTLESVYKWTTGRLLATWWHESIFYMHRNQYIFGVSNQKEYRQNASRLPKHWLDILNPSFGGLCRIVPNLQEEEPHPFIPNPTNGPMPTAIQILRKNFSICHSKLPILSAKLQGLKYKSGKIPANSKFSLRHTLNAELQNCGFSGLVGGPLCVRRRCREIASNRHTRDIHSSIKSILQHQVQSFHMP